jgi:hypothetical protein
VGIWRLVLVSCDLEVVCDMVESWVMLIDMWGRFCCVVSGGRVVDLGYEVERMRDGRGWIGVDFDLLFIGFER